MNSNAASEIIRKFHSYSPDAITLGIENLTVNCDTTNKVWAVNDNIVLNHNGYTANAIINAVHVGSIDIGITAVSTTGFAATGWEVAKV